MPRKKPPAAPVPKPRKGRKADQKPAPDQDAGFVAIPDSMALVPIPKGRKTLYSVERVSALLGYCQRMPLSHACEQPDMPGVQTVSDWERKYPAFSVSLAHARGVFVQRLVDDTIVISDDASGDYRFGLRGITKTDAVDRAKLRIWTRMQYARLMAPRLFNEDVIKKALEIELENEQRKDADDLPDVIEMVGVVAPGRERVS